MINYMQLIGKNHPSVEANCEGDTSVYSNITFVSGSVTKAVLDSEYLDFQKSDRIQEIDTKTNSLIASGFTFDSQQFSLSAPAQINWLGIRAMADLMTFPINISTIDNQQYSLTAVNVDAFVGVGIGTLKAHLDSGRTLKVQINDATDQAELDAVVDNR